MHSRVESDGRNAYRDPEVRIVKYVIKIRTFQNDKPCYYYICYECKGELNAVVRN